MLEETHDAGFVSDEERVVHLGEAVFHHQPKVP